MNGVSRVETSGGGVFRPEVCRPGICHSV